MDAARLRTLLEQHGAVTVAVGPGGSSVRLTRQRTSVNDGIVQTELADGTIRIPVRRIATVTLPDGRLPE